MNPRFLFIEEKERKKNKNIAFPRREIVNRFWKMSSFDNITLVWISYSTAHANLKLTYQLFMRHNFVFSKTRVFQSVTLDFSLYQGEQLCVLGAHPKVFLLLWSTLLCYLIITTKDLAWAASGMFFNSRFSLRSRNPSIILEKRQKFLTALNPWDPAKSRIARLICESDMSVT